MKSGYIIDISGKRGVLFFIARFRLIIQTLLRMTSAFGLNRHFVQIFQCGMYLPVNHEKMGTFCPYLQEKTKKARSALSLVIRVT